MKPLFIAIIIILCQYPIAVLTLMKMFGCKLEKAEAFVWNFAIILLPFVGAGAFWIYYAIRRKAIIEKREQKEKMWAQAAKERREAEAQEKAAIDAGDGVSSVEPVDQTSDEQDTEREP